MYSEFTAFSILSMSTSDPNDQKQKPTPLSGSSAADSSSPSFKTTSCLGGLSAATATENADGFVTPTNSDHRIPETRPCPPPPKKSTAAAHRRMRALKRKRSAVDDVRRRGQSSPPMLLDLSREIESMFPPILQPHLTCKIKKARSV